MTSVFGPKPDAAPLIAKLERFAPLPPDDRFRLRQVVTEARLFGPGTDLICQGEPSDGMLVVLDGSPVGMNCGARECARSQPTLSPATLMTPIAAFSPARTMPSPRCRRARRRGSPRRW